MKGVNMWLKTKIDDNLYNYHIVKILYNKLRYFIDERELNVIDEENLRKDFVLFLHKYSI